MTRYGVRSYSQTVEFSHRRKKLYCYQDNYFDSSWELYLWIYCIDKKLDIKFADISFLYLVDDKEYTYHPDFIIEDKLIEVKGDHFIENNTLINPFNRNLDKYYNAKYECAIQNNVFIVSSSELAPVFEYIDNTYGKQYYRKFIVQRRTKNYG